MNLLQDTLLERSQPPIITDGITYSGFLMGVGNTFEKEAPETLDLT